jgi:hypothetical protein
MIVALKILHVLAAAIWFGHKVLVPGDVRKSIRDLSGSAMFVDRMKQAQRLGIASGLVTVVSGLALTQLVWGITGAPIRIYLGLAAALAIFIVGATASRRAWRRIRSGIDAGDAPAAASGVGPFTRALALENLLWIFALGTMIT